MRWKILSSLLVLVPCAAFSGCGPSRYYFRPAEKAVAESLGGFPAAEYEVSIGGQRFGEARIWSEGVERQERDGVARGVIKIGFEIENTSEAPLDLDVAETRLRVIRKDAKAAVDCRPGPSVSEVRAAPHEVHSSHLDFALPEGMRPRDVRAFRVRWVIRASEKNEQQYEQYTAFVRLEPIYASYYWYSPWYYGYPYSYYPYGGFWFWW